jgi:glycerophosphoryl diester phosphodiesterase
VIFDVKPAATWVELDVRRSSDDELVVWHDRHTRRACR